MRRKTERRVNVSEMGWWTMTAKESAMEALRETEAKIQADREVEARRSACSECSAKDSEIAQLKQENARLIRAESHGGASGDMRDRVRIA